MLLLVNIILFNYNMIIVEFIYLLILFLLIAITTGFVIGLILSCIKDLED